MKERIVAQSNPSSQAGGSVATATAAWALAVAVVSLVLGILSLVAFGLYALGILPGLPFAGSVVCGVMAAVAGHLAHAEMRRARDTRMPLASAGLALGYAGAVLSLAILVLIIPVSRTVSQ
jgi:hypothetical protein